MAFQEVPSTARFAIIHDDSAANHAINVFYYRNDSPWGLPELIDAVNTLRSSWVAVIMPLMTTGARLIRVEARGERAQTDVAYQLEVSPPATGGISSDTLPFQCAYCVTHLTGLTGRSFRGRTYFPFIAEASQQAGILSAAVAAQYKGGLEYIKAQMSAIGWRHVVVSRWANRVRRTQAITTDVIGYRARDVEIDTQRRRTRANAP